MKINRLKPENLLNFYMKQFYKIPQEIPFQQLKTISILLKE